MAKARVHVWRGMCKQLSMKIWSETRVGGDEADPDKQELGKPHHVWYRAILTGSLQSVKRLRIKGMR